MGAVRRFEELIAWQRTRELTKDIYLATRTTPFVRDYGLSGQIQRASVSVMSNIAEGFERGRPAEFGQFLTIAKGSSGEVRSDLYVALDVGYLAPPSFERLMAQVEEVGRLVGGLRLSVQDPKERNWH